MPEETCNYCQAPIIWLKTAESRMPVDAEPDCDRGNVLQLGGSAGVLPGAKARAARAAGTPLHLHHRLSCPHADQWARPKGQR